MESPRHPPRRALSLPSRPKPVRAVSEHFQKSASQPANNPESESTVAKNLNTPKLSRTVSVQRAVWQRFGQIQQPKEPEAEPDPPNLFPQEAMNIIQNRAMQSNGGPVHRPHEVIDLTSNDEKEDFFEDEQELVDHRNEHRIKRERAEAINNDFGDDEERIDIQPFEDPPPEQPLNPPAIPENPYRGLRDVWGDYNLDDDFDNDVMAGVFDDFEHQYPLQPAAGAQLAAQPHPAAPPIQEDIPDEIMEPRIDCVDAVVNVFPGICRDYVSELYASVSKSSERLIAHVLDKMDKGSSYPNAKENEKKLKRKREIDEDAEAARRFGALDRIMPTTVGGIRSFIAKIMSFEFPYTAMNFINATLSKSGYRLFSAYEVLEEAERTWSTTKPYQRLKYARGSDDYTPQKVADFLASPAVHGFIDREKVEVFEELQAARRIRAKAHARREAEHAAEIEEEENVAKAEAEGTMSECECCCCDYPLNRMVHCDGETLHWFCRGCAKRTAEVEIGKSKYELHCMSTDKCSGGFSLEQRSQFLDENTRVALERNEQEANLRLAGIENLESCPFCPFAAEYPPVEVDREFRCQAPDCERVSCRLCKVESHIPKSCEENAKDNGLSIRRQIEEAMSAAMIRKCNKCGTPFVKEEGCNKMTCTRNGCSNIQCYVCSKSCDYNHFNDPARGGKAGNCPLFESVEQRHDEEVKNAEKMALQKILSDHPEYSEEDLKIKMSENVQKDDEKRKSMDPRARLGAIRAAVGRPAFALGDNVDIGPLFRYRRPVARGGGLERLLRPRRHPAFEQFRAGFVALRDDEPPLEPAPVVDVQPAPVNNDPLDEFYHQWRAEVGQRRPPQQPAPIRPRNPGGDDMQKLYGVDNANANPPANLNPIPNANNENPNPFANPAANRPGYYDYNPELRLRRRILRPGAPNRIRDAYIVQLSAAQVAARARIRNQAEEEAHDPARVLAEAEAQNQARDREVLAARMQVAQARLQAAAAGVQQARAQHEAANAYIANAGQLPQPQNPPENMQNYVMQYARLYHAGRQARDAPRRHVADGFGGRNPYVPPGGRPNDGNPIPWRVEDMRALEGRVAGAVNGPAPVHEPEEVDEEYESDAAAERGDEKGVA